MELLKSHKNEVLVIVAKEGFDQSIFRWTTAGERAKPGYEHLLTLEYTNNTEYFYIFHGENKAIFSPGKNWKIEDHEFSKEGYVTMLKSYWGAHKMYICRWLSYLKREIGQKDLWTEIKRYQKSINLESQAYSEIHNARFSIPQSKQIISAIEEVKQYIKENIKITSEQNKRTNERLNYLKDKVNKLGRIDWVNACVGVIFQIAVDLTLSPEKANIIWGFIKNVLIGILKLP